MGTTWRMGRNIRIQMWKADRNIFQKICVILCQLNDENSTKVHFTSSLLRNMEMFMGCVYFCKALPLIAPHTTLLDFFIHSSCLYVRSLKHTSTRCLPCSLYALSPRLICVLAVFHLPSLPPFLCFLLLIPSLLSILGMMACELSLLLS